LPPAAPTEVRHLLERCLAKDRRRRLHDIADARIELEDVGQKMASGVITPAASVAVRPGRRGWLWPAVAGALGVALVAVLVRDRLVPPQPAAKDTGPSVVALEQLTDLAGEQASPNLSPDGRQLLYASLDGDDWDIFLQRVGGEIAINLTEDSPSDDFDPAFSPDGEQIAFHSTREGGGLFVMGATGESPRRVSESGFEPAWSPDGRSLVYTSEHVNDAYNRSTVASLSIVDLETGVTRELFAGDGVGPAWSPGGARIAFWALVEGQRDLWTISAEGGQALRVSQDTHTDWNPLWSPDGRHLYFISDRGGSPDLWRIAIDEASGQVRGDLQPVTVGIANVWEACMSADGRPVVHATSKALSFISISPDGEWLAMGTRTPQEDLYVMRSDGTGRRRLTDDPHRDRGPKWSPDGNWLIWYSNRSGSYEIWAVRPDGTDAHPLTETPGRDLYQPDWSPDGSRIATSLSDDQGIRTVFLEIDQPLGEIRDPLPLVGPEIKDFAMGSWSPDGRRLTGGGFDPSGEWTLMFHDLQTAETHPLYTPGIGYHNGLIGRGWLDEDRFIFWDGKKRAAYLWDAAAGTSREIPGVPGPGAFFIIEDGRTIIANRFRSEFDIWMLGLAEASAKPSAPRPR
jgi:TolB protein